MGYWLVGAEGDGLIGCDCDVIGDEEGNENEESREGSFGKEQDEQNDRYEEDNNSNIEYFKRNMNKPLREQILTNEIKAWEDTLTKQCNDTIQKIEKFIENNKQLNLMFSENVYGCINKENIKCSFGVYEKCKPAMIIFIVSENLVLTCDIHLEYIYDSLLSEVLDLLKMASHIYLVGVCTVDISKFENVWQCITLLKYKEESKLKSIICTPNERKG